MKSATGKVISAFGAFAGLMGVEHGLGEVLQGNAAPSGLVFPSWPDSAFFEILSGEPAMSILPNLLLTGILAIVVSLVFLLWATVYVQREHSGLVLMLLSILLLLLGGGIFPPILGFVLGAVATRLHTPMTWWRKHLSSGARRWLERAWPWSFGAGLLAWLAMFPGITILSYFFGVDSTPLILVVLCCMFGFFTLSIIAGFARDIQKQGSIPS